MNPALMVHGKDGRPYTVRYDQVNAMLLNEFLKIIRKWRNSKEKSMPLKEELKEQRNLIQK